MTKKELIEQLKEYPDDTRIYLQDIESQGNSFKTTVLPVDFVYERVLITGEKIVVMADGF